MKVDISPENNRNPELDPQEASATNTALTEEELIEAAKERGRQAAEEELKSKESAAEEGEERPRTSEEMRESWKSRFTNLGNKKQEATAQDEGVSSDELAQAQEEAAQYREKFVRLQAEWDNFRKRTAAERIEERERATQRLVEGLLPVLDDLERAVEHASNAEPSQEMTSFIEGVEAVRVKMLGVLEKEGVEVIDATEEPLDLTCHQCVGTVEDPSVPDETVRDVYQKGYRMSNYVLRPAMVTITSGGPTRKAEQE